MVAACHLVAATSPASCSSLPTVSLIMLASSFVLADRLDAGQMQAGGGVEAELSPEEGMGKI